MPPKKTNQISNRDFLLMVTPVILAMLVVAFTIGLYVSQKIAMNSEAPGQTPQLPDSTDIPPAGQPLEEAPQINPDAITNVPGEISVAWYSAPEKIDVYASFGVAVDEALARKEYREPGDGLIEAYELGTITSETYKNYTLTVQVLLEAGEMGGPYSTYFYVLIPDDIRKKSVVLQKETAMIGSWGVGDGDGKTTYADWLDPYLSKTFILDTGTSIPSLSFSKNPITLSGGTVIVPVSVGVIANTKVSVALASAISDTDPIVSSVNGRSLYRRAGGNELLYSIRQDGRIVWYDVGLPFWSADYISGSSDINVSVTGGGSFTGNYIKGLAGGCGFSSYVNVTQVPTLPGKTQVFGYANGVAIYELTDSGLAAHRSDMESWLTWNEGKTVDDYVALKPYLYAKDGFGRWIEFVNTKSVYPAECGKPVIYLYPTERADVSVKLEPQGGFTKVEPDYNDGWNVVASPDGSLVNKADGKTYPYLFWEGRGGLYQSPEKYWVIKREAVSTELPKILKAYGLNEKEIADFMEFWAPLMQEDPYYKVGFHGNRVMDQLAPLDISPKPQSVLRILMDYEGLQEPIKANPPKIQPFTRNGFTVVEWGGVLHGK